MFFRFLLASKYSIFNMGYNSHQFKHDTHHDYYVLLDAHLKHFNLAVARLENDHVGELLIRRSIEGEPGLYKQRAGRPKFKLNRYL